MQLYINTKGAYVHIKDQMFEIRIKNGNNEVVKHHFSAKKIQSIVMSEGIALSTDAVSLSVKNNIDIVFVEWDGRPIGRVWHSKLGSTTLIRKEQLKASISKDGLNAVKNWITTKIDNEINFIKWLKKHRQKEVEFLDDKIEKMQALNISISQLEAETVKDVADIIRGLEGTSGRLFFETLNYVLPKNYQFNGRSSRPAKDPFNAFLNYAFGILYSKIEKSLILAGLDPYLGFLHRDDYNQLSFVFDFIEPYRIYAIEVVFKLFSGKKVRQSHTDEITNGFSLNKEGKELLVGAFNNFFDVETIRYKGRNQTRSNAILADARSYANSLIKNNTSDEKTDDIDKIFNL
ncbi:MAG: CRISPR-associated endonuclease Cas1 [Bacteroidales bacterium]|nr:CRISPR-associated endonuclease Cas1 [Bacteroidales bacterium]